MRLFSCCLYIFFWLHNKREEDAYCRAELVTLPPPIPLPPGEVATKRVGGVATVGGALAVVAWDDKLRLGDATTGVLKMTVALPGQPKGVAISAADPSTTIAVVTASIIVVKGGAALEPLAVPYGATCVGISHDGSRVAVGGADKRVHLYSLDAASGALTHVFETPEAGAAINVVSFSPDGNLLAAGDALRDVQLFNGVTGNVLISRRWVNHTTRITGLSWSPNGRLLASVASDRRLCIWEPASESLKKEFELVHPQPLAGVAWSSNEALWTLGADGVATHRVVL